MGKRRTHKSEQLEKEMAECLKVMDEAGLSVGKITGISYKENVRSRWGGCRVCRRRYEEDTFAITISDKLENVDPEKRKNVIFHELIHTVEGCFNHGRKFKAACAKINSLPYGYSVKATNSQEDFGLGAEELEMGQRYAIFCRKCGKLIGRRNRRCKVVDAPSHYRHKGCGGKLYVADMRLGEGADGVAYAADAVKRKPEAKKAALVFEFATDADGQLSFC